MTQQTQPVSAFIPLTSTSTGTSTGTSAGTLSGIFDTAPLTPQHAAQIHAALTPVLCGMLAGQQLNGNTRMETLSLCAALLSAGLTGVWVPGTLPTLERLHLEVTYGNSSPEPTETSELFSRPLAEVSLRQRPLLPERLSITAHFTGSKYLQTLDLAIMPGLMHERPHGRARFTDGFGLQVMDVLMFVLGAEHLQASGQLGSDVWLSQHNLHASTVSDISSDKLIMDLVSRPDLRRPGEQGTTFGHVSGGLVSRLVNSVILHGDETHRRAQRRASDRAHELTLCLRDHLRPRTRR